MARRCCTHLPPVVAVGSMRRVTGVIVVEELASTAGAVDAIACAETTTSAGVMRMMGRPQPPRNAAQRR